MYKNMDLNENSFYNSFDEIKYFTVNEDLSVLDAFKEKKKMLESL